MGAAVRAGVVYGAGGFALGFVLGTLRTLVLAPRIGEGWALAIELPLMLLFGWLFAGWCIWKSAIPANGGSKWLAAGLALFILQLLELSLAWALGQPPDQYLRKIVASAESLSGASAQVVYAVFLVHRAATARG